MLPLETIATHTTPSGAEISIDRRGGTSFFRLGQDTIMASNALDAGLVMAEQVCHPVRSARQPQILVASRGFGELASGVLNLIIQKRGQIVIHDPEPIYAQWQKEFFEELFPELHDDKRIVSTSTPLPELLEATTEGWHGIVADLDILAATNPTMVPLFSTQGGLTKVASNLREGSLIGVTQAEYYKKILTTMGSAGLNPVTDELPVTAKARRSKFQTVVLAQKGEYHPQSQKRYARR